MLLLVILTFEGHLQANNSLIKNRMAQLPSHTSVFFSTAATCSAHCLQWSTLWWSHFLGASITNIRTQIAKLLCRMANPHTREPKGK